MDAQVGQGGACAIDLAMRCWMNDVRAYVPPVGIGMRAGAIGRVIESAHDEFAVGDWVAGSCGGSPRPA